ncbi:MAG TPA: CpsD/CapB family tyrosine-protein kinase [Terriglobales bacterium]
MSKLFEMLYKSKGEKIADAVLPLVDGQASPPRVGGGFKSEGAPAAAAAAEAALGSAAAAAAPGLTQIRTLSLHVPAPSPLLPFEKGQWRPSEQYRTLRTKLSQHPKQPHLIVISSPESGDGKSVTAINTAGALALKSEGQVLLLDADLRKATIYMQLGLPQSPGLADVLAGACTPEEALVRTKELPNLYVVSSGTPPANPVELLDSARWRTLCAELRDVFRYVIIDSPPVGTVADYELIQAVCDGVILVMRPDFTNRHLCKCALDFVPNAKFLGVVLNCVPDWSPGKYTGSNYYYYSSSPENAYRK